ncbi:MAG: VOC family protein [Acidimicrobiales bacterium]
MVNLTPFLLFDGECGDAMAFYQTCLGGELAVTMVKDTPMKDQFALEHHNKVINAHLKSGLIEFTATDWLHPTRTPKTGNTVCMHLTGGTKGELSVLFERLSVGADPELVDLLRDMPFGSYGHLVDRYGIHWFFQGDGS